MADEQELYDEFGNYIGPDLDSSSSDDSSEGDDASVAPGDASDVSEDDDVSRDGGGRADRLVVRDGGGGDNLRNENGNLTVGIYVIQRLVRYTQ